jgi:DNA-binding transcriptional ArsR family regulator
MANDHVGQVSSRTLGLPAPATSRHLRELKQGGLVEETHPEFDARVGIYAPKGGAMAELKRWHADTKTMWSAQLSGLKAHVEKTRGEGASRHLRDGKANLSSQMAWDRTRRCKPSCRNMREWRARRDSNSRPSDSKSDALSS